MVSSPVTANPSACLEMKEKGRQSILDGAFENENRPI